MRTFLIILLLTNMANASVCKSYDKFYSDSQRGWHYGEVCITDNNTDEYRTLPTIVTVPWEKLNSIDPDDVQKIENEARKIAITYPTEQNIIEYKKLVGWMTKKSQELYCPHVRIVKVKRVFYTFTGVNYGTTKVGCEA